MHGKQPDVRTGQRWISESEPQLGLGSIRRVTARTLTVVFGASEESREYARDNAPLRRVNFRIGDTIRNGSGATLVVQAVVERAGLIFYAGAGQEWCETELSSAISFSQPEQRLLAGHVDPTEVFDLRASALAHQFHRRKSNVRGLVGGRIELIPHQLFIASEVAARLVPRVLLADEVGLGKTIEACLILHRLMLTGRAQRVLILVPDSLVHQWFVELLRRFNLWFHIFDEERCAAIETANPDANPFLDDQLVLAGIRLFTGHDRRVQQALSAGWDLLIVDEAHHLGWSLEGISPEYAVVEALGRRTPGLFLLTATPEQLGLVSHFARLRLLDPDRFHALDEFIHEAERYRDVARLAEKVIGNRPLGADDVGLLARTLPDTEANVRSALRRPEGRQELLGALLDQHGTGRVMFRNTRATIAGFPRRVARLYPLAAPAGELGLLEWLADLLHALGRDKVLLICATPPRVAALDAALRQRLNVKQAVFHEGLTLVQRDRNAAWFGEEDGARIMICSEIGSEGRNFQFAHHLVLFDLPLDPELVEQRIGRLDRIGQTAEIQVHIPFIVGSSQEVLARWHHEGLNAFEQNLHGGHTLLERFGARVRQLAEGGCEPEALFRANLKRLIAETQAARQELAAQLEQGRDRLLELNSFNSERGGRLVEAIRLPDADRTLDEFMLAVFDHYAVNVEEVGARTYRLGSAGVFADSFPGLPAAGLTVTCDRQRALAREEVQFLTWDHPLVTGALDMLLGSEQGNSSFAWWPDSGASGLYVETVYLLECVAPPPLHVDRFLPPTPLRVLVDQRGNEVGRAITVEWLARHLKDGEAHALLDRREVRETLLPMLLAQTEAMARRQVPTLVAQAIKEMNHQLGHELARLNALRKVNRSVRPEELALLDGQRRALELQLAGARLRLDAIRVIQRGPGCT